MKKIIIIVAIIILIALGVGFMYFAAFERSTQYQSEDDTPAKTPYEKLCRSGGGKLRGFPNGCGDACVSKEKGNMLCTQKHEEGCDCGENKCWDGNKCVGEKK